MERTPKIGAVEITFEIVEYLVDHGPAGVAETARMLDRPISTVHDYLQSLASQGYVVNEAGTYRPSMRFLAVGEQTRDALPIYQASEEPLRSLAEAVDFHVSVLVEEHGRVVIIDTIPGSDPIELVTHSGIRMGMHTTSPGKAILAHLPNERIDEIIERHGLQGMTESTITSRAQLDSELETIRERGYATDDEERLVGVRTAAVPVIDRDDTVHGALTVYGPKHRITDQHLHETLPQHLGAASNAAEMNLNY